MSDQQELKFSAPADDPVTVYLASGLTSRPTTNPSDTSHSIVATTSGVAFDKA